MTVYQDAKGVTRITRDGSPLDKRLRKNDKWEIAEETSPLFTNDRDGAVTWLEANNIPDILDYVKDNPEAATTALEAERTRAKPRKNLERELEALIAEGTPPEQASE